MEWILLIGFGALVYYRVKRAREKAAEHAATGMLRSSLYWTASSLTMLLLGLSLYMVHLSHEGPIPSLCWPIVAALLFVILLLRRSLKWRYPI